MLIYSLYANLYASVYARRRMIVFDYANVIKHKCADLVRK